MCEYDFFLDNQFVQNFGRKQICCGHYFVHFSLIFNSSFVRCTVLCVDKIYIQFFFRAFHDVFRCDVLLSQDKACCKSALPLNVVLSQKIIKNQWKICNFIPFRVTTGFIPFILYKLQNGLKAVQIRESIRHIRRNGMQTFNPSDTRRSFKFSHKAHHKK